MTSTQTPIVRMQKLHKHFGSLHVLKDIDLEIVPGEVVVVIGASGSGKSTLIRCINGLEEFQSGSLDVDGNTLLPNGKSSQALQTIRTEVAWCSSSSISSPSERARQHYAGTHEGPRLSRKTPRDRSGWSGGIADQADKHPSQLPAASSSGRRARWRWSRASCCSTVHLSARSRDDW